MSMTNLVMLFFAFTEKVLGEVSLHLRVFLFVIKKSSQLSHFPDKINLRSF